MCVTIILTIMCAVCFSLLLSVFVNRSFPQILAKFDSTTCGGLVNIGVFVEKKHTKKPDCEKADVVGGDHLFMFRLSSR